MTSSKLNTILWLALLSGMLWSSADACVPGTFTANPQSCNEYFLCISSGSTTTTIPLKCKTGLNFDPSKGVCTASYNCLICD